MYNLSGTGKKSETYEGEELVVLELLPFFLFGHQP
jgi:hypothetical protein